MPKVKIAAEKDGTAKCTGKIQVLRININLTKDIQERAKGCSSQKF